MATKKRTSKKFDIGPVYHAQGRNHAIDRPWTYWSKKPRPQEFGRYITVAMLRMENPYEGWKYHARDVAGSLDVSSAKRLYQDLDLGDNGGQPLAPGIERTEAFWDSLGYALETRHYHGVWQHPDTLKAIERAGFDGVISKDPFGGETEWVAARPSQVMVLDEFVVPQANPKRTSRRRR